MMANRGSFLSKVVESLQYRSSIADNSKIPSISNDRLNFTFECTSNKQSKKINIVGRDDQLNELHEIFDRMKISEKIEIVLIHGAPGTGKSSLVDAFTQNRSYDVLFAKGKFDQLQSHVPYSALVAASDQLCRQILMQKNSVVIRERIRSILGPEINLLGSLMPMLIEMAGVASDKVNSNLEENMGESFTRFKLLFRAFLRSSASDENPVIFFLDDLQWADAASLDVLNSIVTDTLSRNIMIICSFRDDEMSIETLRKLNLLRKHNQEEDSTSLSGQHDHALITDILIESLDEIRLNDLIASKLDMELTCTQSLSQLIWKKTGGNPFHALSFLEMLSMNSLLVKANQGGWTWDESQILRVTNVSDNLACILESKLKSLPEQTRSILQIASFIGHEFPLSILVTIVHEEQDAIASEYCFHRQSIQVIKTWISSALKIALHEGLLIQSHKIDEYMFSHDKIQEVLYETLMPDETERKLLHQRIGVIIWDSAKDKEPSQVDDWLIFLAADNLNRAITLVDYSGDRYSLVGLNLTAAKRTIHKSAFLLASEYLRLAVDLLNFEFCWEEKYELCLEVFNTAAENEKNIGCFIRSANLVETIHSHAKHICHRSIAFATEIDSLTSQGNLKDSVKLGLCVLRQLGIKLPRKINLLFILKEVVMTTRALGRRQMHDLLCLQEIHDEKILLSLSIMSLIVANAFTLADAYKEVFAAICLKMFRITLKSGISKKFSPTAIIAWGCLNASLGRFDISQECEKLAFNIIDKYGMESIRGANTIISYSLNHFWRGKLDSDSCSAFLTGYHLAMRYGSINIAQQGVFAWLGTSLYLDDQLIDIHVKTRSFVTEMREFKSINGLMLILPSWQALLNVSGDKMNVYSSHLRGEALDEAFVSRIKEIDSKTALLNLYVMESVVSYLFDDDEFVLKNLWFLTNNQKEMQGHCATGFLKTWLSIFHYERFLITGKRVHKRLGRLSHKKVQYWTATGTEMLHCLSLFLDSMAMLCVSKAPCETLVSTFLKSANACADSRCQLFEALSYEYLAKEYYKLDPKGTNFLMYRNQAITLYQNWGAIAKADHVAMKFASQ